MVCYSSIRPVGLALHSSRRQISQQQALTRILIFADFVQTDQTIFTGISGFSPGATALLGYSRFAIMIVLILSIILAAIPILLAFQRLDRHTAGSNSAVISAACHVSPIGNASQTQPPPKLLPLESTEATDPTLLGPKDTSTVAETRDGVATDPSREVVVHLSVALNGICKQSVQRRTQMRKVGSLSW